MKAATAVHRFRRHLEGWPLGLVVVGVVALTAALAVPRPVEPHLIPPPIIDRRTQLREAETERSRAERAKAGLPLEVRSVGEALRRFGAAASRGTDTLLPQLTAQLRRLVDVAIERHGTEKLLELRALQCELFTRELEKGGAAASAELGELGGEFYAAGSARGWFESALDLREIGTLYRVYWSETLGLLRRHPYSPTLNEWRVYYRFLLAHPQAGAGERAKDVQRELGYVAALAQHDQDYPAHLARGVLLFQLGAHAEAALELRAHVARFPDGPWGLRARNYLAACGAALSE